MISKYEFIPTEIEGVVVISPFFASDERGFVKKTFERNIFLDNGIDFNPIEEMETTSKKGVIRGLHFQTSNAQAKLVRCVKGEILDVAVDLRKDSPTFGKSFSVILSSENKKMLYIPRGFAHGCIILLDDTTFYYLSDNKYCPEYDSGIVWDDKDLAINWQLDNIDKIILSEKDRNLKTFQQFKENHNQK
jgi:dTDP-4-dehydrorhamnose 3,5-epimerase